MTYDEFTLTSESAEISVYRWVPDDPCAAVLISHGAVEHARRYDGFARFLASHGFAVYANDHRGHGRTAGLPENVAYLGETGGGFLQMVEDMHCLTLRIKSDLPGLPVFLLGHSMGSLIARVYAAKYGSELAGPTRQSTCLGLVTAIGSLAAMVGSLLGGVLFDRMGTAGLYRVLAGFALVAFAGFVAGQWLIRRRSQTAG